MANKNTKGLEDLDVLQKMAQFFGFNVEPTEDKDKIIVPIKDKKGKIITEIIFLKFQDGSYHMYDNIVKHRRSASDVFDILFTYSDKELT